MHNFDSTAFKNDKKKNGVEGTAGRHIKKLPGQQLEKGNLL